jgi:hypothetical protein
MRWIKTLMRPSRIAFAFSVLVGGGACGSDTPATSNPSPASATASAGAPAATEPGILDLAARRDPEGATRTPRHGDARLEAAVQALADMPQPWTVAAVASAYARERDPARRAHLLALLAVSRDPRAALRLGEALDDPNVAVRAAATQGLARYFADPPLVGGSEQAAEAARAYWRDHEAELRRSTSAR